MKNTGSALKWANGWTDWDVSWADYVKGSALPAASTGDTPGGLRSMERTSELATSGAYRLNWHVRSL